MRIEMPPLQLTGEAPLLAQLPAGARIKVRIGEVNQQDGSVMLRLQDGSQVRAQVAPGAQLAQGQAVMVEVASAGENRTVLRILNPATETAQGLQGREAAWAALLEGAGNSLPELPQGTSIAALAHALAKLGVSIRPKTAQQALEIMAKLPGATPQAAAFFSADAALPNQAALQAFLALDAGQTLDHTALQALAQNLEPAAAPESPPAPATDRPATPIIPATQGEATQAAAPASTMDSTPPSVLTDTTVPQTAAAQDNPMPTPITNPASQLDAPTGTAPDIVIDAPPKTPLPSVQPDGAAAPAIPAVIKGDTPAPQALAAQSATPPAAAPPPQAQPVAADPISIAPSAAQASDTSLPPMQNTGNAPAVPIAHAPSPRPLITAAESTPLPATAAHAVVGKADLPALLPKLLSLAVQLREQPAQQVAQGLRSAAQGFSQAAHALAESEAAMAGAPAAQQAATALAQAADLSQQVQRFAYLPLPLQMGDRHEMAELYVMKRGGGRSPLDPQDVTLLLALSTAALSRVEGLLRVQGRSVALTLRVEDDAAGAALKQDEAGLCAALAENGYHLSPIRVQPLAQPTTPLNAHTVLQQGFDAPMRQHQLNITI